MSFLQTAMDAAATATAVAAESIRIASGRRERIGRDDVSRFCAAAISEAFPGVRVSNVAPIDAHSGTTHRARFAVEYDNAGADEHPPVSVFVKTVPRSPAVRLFVNLMQLAVTEVRFYRDIAASVPISVPRCWHLQLNERTGSFVLVLEDLAARGARFADVSENVDVESANRVIETLARLHAAFWDSPRLRSDLAWLRAPGSPSRMRLERTLCRALVSRGVTRFAETVPPSIRDATARIVAARDRLEEAWREGPMTLLHGDSHIGNMYFVDDVAGLLDWQVAQRGQGMRDVSYFLVNSLPTQVRREQERNLIERWRAVLDDSGVRPPSFDTAWRQHRLHATYAWVGCAVTAAARDLQPDPIARAGLTRASQALVDLTSLGALQEIGA